MAWKTRTALTEQVFFDTDCLSSFFWADQECLLCKLFADRMVIPKEVYDELLNPHVPYLNEKVRKLVDDKAMRVKEIYADTEEFAIFFDLTLNPKIKKRIGKGEAAAISLAKVYKGVLASNNLKDISKYIEEYALKHLTTGHILLDALEKTLIKEAEGNVIWEKMRSKKRRMPFETFSDYVEHCHIASKV
ncbi:MAG TPA: hypothetical protein PK581_09470 [Caldisericia bacterium]|nr:hypothetical protein [Caldisericia bacterium]